MRATAPTPVPQLSPNPARAAAALASRSLAFGLATVLALSAAAIGWYLFQQFGRDAQPALLVDQSPETTANRSPSFAHRFDLNQATAGELESLDGIGPKLAQRIVTYREEHGPFASVDQVDKVPGIGPKLLERLRPYVYVNDETAVSMDAPGIPAKSGRLAKKPPERPFDLNRATREQLMQIPGIGEGWADRILADRASRGAYAKVSDLTRIDGLKQKMLEKLQPYLFVADGRTAGISP